MPERCPLTGYDPITCPNCGVEYAHRPGNRMLGVGVIFITLGVLYMINQVFQPGLGMGWQLLIWLLVNILLSFALVPLLRFEAREKTGVPGS